MPKIYYIDVTNRDAVQASRIILAKLQKTMVNIYLGELGIHQSEFAFPFLKHEQNYIQANLALQKKGAMGNLILEGWCRAVIADVEKGLSSGVRDLNLSISTSDQMIKNKFQGKLDHKQVIHEMKEAARFAKAGGCRTVGVNAEDASRSDIEFLIEFIHTAKEAGAERFRYCDTLGCDTPFTIYERIRRLAEATGMAIELHCHNDIGMAVANSIAGAKAALDGGVDAYINTSINGIGERAGQADLLSCILALKFGAGMEKYQIADKINLPVISKLSRYTAEAFCVPIPINQPGVGANAFAHESGIHADGALKDRRNYELYDYELLGIKEEESQCTGRVITTGEYGGVSGLKHVYEKLGITFSNNGQAQQILELVQYANAHTQQPLADDELLLIYNHPEEVRKLLLINI